VLVALFVIFQIYSQIQAQRANKLQNMDENEINDLALELEGDENNNNDNNSNNKKLQKKKARVEQRLAAERKKAAKTKQAKNKNDNDEDDDDVGDITTFAKGSRGKKKN